MSIMIKSFVEYVRESIVNRKTAVRFRSYRKEIDELIRSKSLQTVYDMVRFLDNKNCAVVINYDSILTEFMRFPKKNSKLSVLAKRTDNISEWLSIYTPGKQIIKIYPRRHIAYIYRNPDFLSNEMGKPEYFHGEELTDNEWIRMLLILCSDTNAVL